MTTESLDTARGRVLSPGEGRPMNIGVAGGALTMKVEGPSAGGLVTVFENRLRPHAPGPARHFHRRFTEMFYVLEGNMVYELDGKLREAPAGTLVFVPPGTVHAFRNPSDDAAKLLVSFTPGGFEGFFDEAEKVSAPMTDPVWKDINERYDVNVVGPPLESE